MSTSVCDALTLAKALGSVKQVFAEQEHRAKAEFDEERHRFDEERHRFDEERQALKGAIDELKAEVVHQEERAEYVKERQALKAKIAKFKAEVVHQEERAEDVKERQALKAVHQEERAEDVKERQALKAEIATLGGEIDKLKDYRRCPDCFGPSRDLQEDVSSFDETDFEGVSYLEDEETGKIYNPKHQHVGKWNENVDDIIWVSEDFKNTHETSRP